VLVGQSASHNFATFRSFGTITGSAVILGDGFVPEGQANRQLRELCRAAHANERSGRSCVCAIDALVTAGTIPTVTCTSLLYVQIRRAAPTALWAACRFTIHKKRTARHGRAEKRPHVDETRSLRQLNLHGHSSTPGSSRHSVTSVHQTTGRVRQFSRSEITFFRGFDPRFLPGYGGVVDLLTRPTSKAGLLALFLRSFLHHSKKWVSSFSLYWGAQGLGES
jgi:hypothetical protein